MNMSFEEFKTHINNISRALALYLDGKYSEKAAKESVKDNLKFFFESAKEQND